MNKDYNDFVKIQSIKESILKDTEAYGRTQFVDEIYKLQEENENLKQKLNEIAFGDDPELALRYLRKIGYVDFDNDRKVYINKHSDDSFLCKNEEEKDYYIKDEELDEYTQQLICKNNKLEDSWNKLKEYIDKTKIKEFEKSYGKRYGKTFTQAEIIVCNMIKDKIKELEKEV